MSTCISRHGEYSVHVLDELHTCTRCHVLDEDAMREELAIYKALSKVDVSALREAQELVNFPAAMSALITELIEAAQALQGFVPKVNPMQNWILQLYRGVDMSGYDGPEAEKTNDINEAQVISSEIMGWPGHHLVVLDIDMPVKVIPSSTPGHFHLYIEKSLTWFEYVDLLGALERAGIVEAGYVNASIARQGTRVRLPWIKKGATA